MRGYTDKSAKQDIDRALPQSVVTIADILTRDHHRLYQRVTDGTLDESFNRAGADVGKPKPVSDGGRPRLAHYWNERNCNIERINRLAQKGHSEIDALAEDAR